MPLQAYQVTGVGWGAIGRKKAVDLIKREREMPCTQVMAGSHSTHLGVEIAIIGTTLLCQLVELSLCPF